jgi:DNA-binding transcriptional MerR regulator
MQSYSVRDVERVLRLSRGTIQGLIKGGFVKPTRGPRRQYRFSFQDLIVLRTARALTQAKVPTRRIRRSLEDLRQHLPEAAPLSGLSIRAVGDRVVVRDGKTHWQVDDRQYVLELDVSVAHGELRVVERREPIADTAKQPETGFMKGCSSRPSIRARRRSVRRAVDDDPHNAAAWINWGRLLHEHGDTSERSRSISVHCALWTGFAAHVQPRWCSRTWGGLVGARRLPIRTGGRSRPGGLPQQLARRRNARQAQH